MSLSLPRMFEPDTLPALFALLQEMSSADAAARRVRSPCWLDRLEGLSFYAYVLLSLSLACGAWVYHRAPTPAHACWLWALYITQIGLGLSYLLSLLMNLLRLAWRQRRPRQAVLPPWLLHEMQADAQYLLRLQAFDQATLEYALLQYRHDWDRLEGRVNLMVGELRKLGLFPALAASAIAASTLLKNGSHLYGWLPLLLASCFYLLGFAVSARRERPQQVMALLDYAISHARPPVVAQATAEPG